MRIALLTVAALAILVVGCGPTDGPETGQSEAEAALEAANASPNNSSADSNETTDGPLEDTSSGEENASLSGQDVATASGPDDGASLSDDGATDGADASDPDSNSDADEDADKDTDKDGPEPTPDPTLQAFYSSFQPPLIGDPEAPVTILEFSDYLCPYCGVYAGDTSHEIEDEYVDDGRVSMVFIDFPIPGHGYPAVISHEAAHCASEQNAYWEMHYALFEQQEQLTELDPRDEEAAIPVVSGIADNIGLDGEAIAACIESHIYRPIIGSLMEQAQARGINVTPTLLIMSAAPDGEVRNEAVTGYLPMEDFRPYLERALSHSQGTPVPDPVTEMEE